MKKLICVFLLAVVLLTSCNGDIGFGSGHTSNPADFGKWNKSFVAEHSFLPRSLDGFTVNAYSYTYDAYMDICYEIFVDLTVTKEQLSELIAAARADGRPYSESAAYYASGYREIVFMDVYEISDYEDGSGDKYVGWADIEKVIYNEETCNIIYECFHANDTSVYSLSDVAYFKRFGIDEEKYAEGLDTSNPII